MKLAYDGPCLGLTLLSQETLDFAGPCMLRASDTRSESASFSDFLTTLPPSVPREAPPQLAPLLNILISRLKSRLSVDNLRIKKIDKSYSYDQVMTLARFGCGTNAKGKGKANVVANALSRKERIKPLRVRALVMTIGLDLPRKILEAQTEARRPENLKSEDVGGMLIENSKDPE
nr:reverse transcriptase domain-containing protein [Tanacetum cinerariifolium]